MSQISPGMVQTEFVPRAFKDEEIGQQRYAKVGRCLQAEDIAEAVIYALSVPDHVRIDDIHIKPNNKKF